MAELTPLWPISLEGEIRWLEALQRLVEQERASRTIQLNLDVWLCPEGSA